MSLLHRTNIEKYWVENGLPDNAAAIEDKVVVVSHGKSITFPIVNFKAQKAKTQAELTALYGKWTIGEPMATKTRGASVLKANGLVGIYSPMRTGEGLSPDQVQDLIQKALAEVPPGDTRTRANELLRGV
jgi:hypothetical protein